jgi:hypothetical protein
MNEASSPQIQASSSVSDTAKHHLSAYVTFNHQKIKEIGKKTVFILLGQREL